MLQPAASIDQLKLFEHGYWMSYFNDDPNQIIGSAPYASNP